MAVPILVPRREWWCPKCTTTSVTERAGLHVEFHHCRGLHGLWSPMFERGERGHIVTVEREDYGGRDKLTTDARGRPIMRVEKWVGDQQKHVIVFAPSGQHRVGVDRLAEVAPLPVRRKGSIAIQRWAVDRIRQLVTKGRP